MYSQVLYFVSLGQLVVVKLNGGTRVPLRVKVTWADFVSFAFMRHRFSHNWILFRCVWSLCDAMAGSPCVARTAVSSAKLAVQLSVAVGKSAV
jgi:hypothetical protein